MNEMNHLTRAERIQRIGKLLAKGVTLLLMREAEEKRLAHRQALSPTVEESAISRANDPSGATVLDEDERRILDYLKRVKRASPREMQCCLDLRKATLFRKLKRLLEAKLVVYSGRTTAIRYQLAGPSGLLA
jgi:hypothetical protein